MFVGVCVYVWCEHACLYMCVYLSVSVYISLYIYIYIYIYKHIHTYTHMVFLSMHAITGTMITPYQGSLIMSSLKPNR